MVTASFLVKELMLDWRKSIDRSGPLPKLRGDESGFDPKSKVELIVQAWARSISWKASLMEIWPPITAGGSGSQV